MRKFKGIPRERILQEDDARGKSQKQIRQILCEKLWGRWVLFWILEALLLLCTGIAAGLALGDFDPAAETYGDWIGIWVVTGIMVVADAFCAFVIWQKRPARRYTLTSFVGRVVEFRLESVGDGDVSVPVFENVATGKWEYGFHVMHTQLGRLYRVWHLQGRQECLVEPVYCTEDDPSPCE